MISYMLETYFCKSQSHHDVIFTWRCLEARNAEYTSHLANLECFHLIDQILSAQTVALPFHQTPRLGGFWITHALPDFRRVLTTLLH